MAGNSGRSGRFTDQYNFGRFVADELDKIFESFVNTNSPYPVQVAEFIREIDAEGSISVFVDRLYSQLADRPDLRRELRPIIYKIRQVSKWFCHYNEVDDNCRLFAENAVFPRLGEYGRLLQEDVRDFVKIRKLDKAAQEEIYSARQFVALVGKYYSRSRDQREILTLALDTWRKLDTVPGYQFLVFLLGSDAQDWWKSLALDGEGIHVERLEEEPGDEEVRKAEQILSSFPERERRVGLVRHPVIVLGEEQAPAPGPGHDRRAVDDLVSYLRQNDPKRVEHWGDGWYRKNLTGAERARLFGSEPVFVRALIGDDTAKEAIRARLKGALLSATGFGHLDDGAWNEYLAQLKRVYWSAGRPNWAGMSEPNEFWLAGQVEDIGRQLAELAGFDGAAPHSIGHIRYERPDLRDKAKREKAEQLLARELPEAVRPDGGDGTMDTVPIIEEGIEESIRKFSPSTLNVLAVHDLETRPGDEDDAIERFSRAEDKIRTVVKTIDGGQDLEIVRVAVLFNNFRTFDGVRFDQGSPVSKWNLLKCPSSDTGIELDPIDLMALKRQARLQWESICAQRALL